MLVTFDLFSALIDSRTGGTAAFGRLTAAHGWHVPAEDLYDRWDAANKASQRDTAEWVPFTEHSRRALAAAYAQLGLDGDGLDGDGLDDDGDGDADADVGVLLGTVGDWPLWPDVESGLAQVAERFRVGVLSNVDDVVFARTRVAPLVADDAVLTSERLRAYKPAREIYRRARERAGGALVHVATSARDVRGALEAGLDVVRLRRPGHGLDPDGPEPRHEVTSVAELLGVLDQR